MCSGSDFGAFSMILDSRVIRLKHSHCPHCGSEQLEIVWKVENPDLVTYECKNPQCGKITEESAQ
jgi:ssDNA-binding Zn-finger/Zn-ribbon topoisomerase 1